jgi:hypothetical protein
MRKVLLKNKLIIVFCIINLCSAHLVYSKGLHAEAITEQNEKVAKLVNDQKALGKSSRQLQECLDLQEDNKSVDEESQTASTNDYHEKKEKKKRHRRQPQDIKPLVNHNNTNIQQKSDIVMICEALTAAKQPPVVPNNVATSSAFESD